MSGSSLRLEAGGMIDRTKPLRFIWEGKAYTGFKGDTLASALLANGIRIVGRSFKYHRPRGIFAAGVEECNALIQLGTGARNSPNMRATEINLYEGLVAKPVNCWPNARFDLGAVNSLISRFLPAGFYYKTFMWPDWHLYEGFIRRAAGLGKIAKTADPDRYESRFAHCDILVVGAGPAGLTAALESARGGARVILVEQDGDIGGALHHDDCSVDDRSGLDWAKQALDEFTAMPETSVLLRTSAVGYHDHNCLTLVEQMGSEADCANDPRVARYRTWLVRARQVILATGAIERPLAFPGNDRPGVMLASAVRHYISRFAVLPGKRSVVFTNNDDAYRTAMAIHDCDGAVEAVVDIRSDVSNDLIEALNARNIPLLAGASITDTKGHRGLRAVRVRTGGTLRWISCDMLCVSGGYNPSIHLFSQSGGKLLFDHAIAAHVPDSSLPALQVCGAVAGSFALREAVEQGWRTGQAAALAVGFEATPQPIPACAPGRVDAPIKAAWHVDGGQGKAFVDLQNDVTVSDIALSAQENFQSVEHLKRYTTLGMAADQGKTANVNALAIMAALTGRSIGETGYTRYRPPYVPVALGTFAGRNRGDLFRPLRRMPADRWHRDAGAIFEDFGGWSRPACYLRERERPVEAMRREALTVRAGVGLFDGSPLGKIEVKGPDAARFLDLIYANTMSTLKVGKVRYGLMLNEQGVVIDDGVAARIDEDLFLICTSSAGAERIAAWMEEWLQCEWLDMKVLVAPITTAWGVLTLTGPHAKAVLQKVGTDLDFDAFPHMSFATGQIGGIAARVLRVSYTGESSYEINVPARSTEPLWRRMMEEGSDYGIAPIGIDAWDILRTEKGFLHVGADTDGTTSALDLGWTRILEKPAEFVGKRSLFRAENQRSDRLNFVGLSVDRGQQKLPVGAHIITSARDSDIRSEGYVTSSCDSPVLGVPVALAMLKNGRNRMGEKVRLKAGSEIYTATVASPAFYDPEGTRLDV